MSDDLVRQLEACLYSKTIGGHNCFVQPGVVREAADRIEAQAAEIRSLREQVARARLEGAEIMREAAARWAEDDAKLCDCSAHSESECACGAWCEWKTVPMHHVVQAIRNIDPAAILEAHTRAKAMDELIAGDADLLDVPSARSAE